MSETSGSDFPQRKDSLPESSGERSKPPHKKSFFGRVDEAMFGSGGRNPVGVQKEEPKIPYKQIDSGMKELRTRLLESTDRMNKEIESARDDDLKPRKGWSKTWDKVRTFLDGGSREEVLRRTFSPTIKKNHYLIDRINQGDEETIKMYLFSSIEDGIKLAVRGVMITEDRGFGNRIIDGVQKDIDTLAKFDPRMASHWQKELNKKTGNPIA